MKSLLFICLNLIYLHSLCQSGNLPSVTLKDMNGQNINTDVVFQPGTAILLVFWKSDDHKCCENLSSIHESWLETLKNQSVRLITICEDCKGGWTHIKPLIMGRGFDFEVYIDTNGDFKRAMGVGNSSVTILLDESLNQICRHNGYCTGSGELICEKILMHLKTN